MFVSLYTAQQIAGKAFHGHIVLSIQVFSLWRRSFISMRSGDANCSPYKWGVIPFTADLLISFIVVLLFFSCSQRNDGNTPTPVGPPSKLVSRSFPSGSVKLLCADLWEQNKLLAVAFRLESGNFFPSFNLKYHLFRFAFFSHLILRKSF